MKEKDIIKNLKKLRKTSPEKDWVLSNKRELLGEDFSYFSAFSDFSKNLVFLHKFATASFLLMATFIGVGVYAQNSLPGDTLYSLRKVTERAQFTFKSGDVAVLSFEVAERRLDDLDRVVKNNFSKNLAPTINEFQDSVSEAARNVRLGDVKDVEAFAKRIEKMEERKERIQSLGIEVGENKELNLLKGEMICKNTSDLIEFIETRTLTKQQEEILLIAKELFEEKKCQEAEEKILIDLERANKNQDTDDEDLDEDLKNNENSKGDKDDKDDNEEKREEGEEIKEELEETKE